MNQRFLTMNPPFPPALHTLGIKSFLEDDAAQLSLQELLQVVSQDTAPWRWANQLRHGDFPMGKDGKHGNQWNIIMKHG